MSDLISRIALLKEVDKIGAKHIILSYVKDKITNAPAIEQGKPVAVVDEVAISIKGEHIFNGVGKVNVGDKLYAAPPQQQWVSVDDRLPDGQRVLIKTTTIGQAVASRSGNWKLDGTWGHWNWGVINDININQDEVTHWMPLPIAQSDKHVMELTATIAELESDAVESNAHIAKLGGILTDTANALKGEPKELSSHSWHDLADKAEESNKRIAELEDEINDLKKEQDLLNKWLDSNRVWFENSNKEIAELKAHINVLREALENITKTNASTHGTTQMMLAHCMKAANEALASTPAQSLQEHDDAILSKERNQIIEWIKSNYLNNQYFNIEGLIRDIRELSYK